MKKLFAAFLALVMMMSLLSVTAFAATPAPKDIDSHTYTAYQIFSGTQADGDAALGNIAWGSGINADAFLAALKTSFGDTFKDCNTAADVAAAMKDWADKSANAKAFAKLAEDYVKGTGTVVVNHQSELEAGYYLVVDTTESVAADDAKNVALLQLTKKGTFEIAQKNEVPEVEKKIVEGENRVDANNAAIGANVPYEIKTTVPVSTPDYEYYFFIIRDTLSKGLTFNNDIAVTIGGKTAVAGTDYSVKYNDGGYTFQIALIDAAGNAGKDVVVTYSATVNKDAVVGVEGNPNTVDIKYSNNPNEDYDGKPTDDNNPGFPKDETVEPKGVTPKDYTITYTTQLKLFKVDQDKQPLNGAEFTLYGDTLKKVLVYTEVFTEATDGTYYKLNNGTYTTQKPIAEDYMKVAEDGATAGYVVDDSATGEGVVKVGGVTYRPYVPAEDADMAVYVLVKANADQYASTETMYKMDSLLTEKDAAGDKLNVVAMVDDNGEVMFTGLSAGNYTLSETKTPSGYNTIADINFSISWAAPAAVTAGDEDCTWSVGANDQSGVTYVSKDNAFELIIENQKGATLPETGGIGTTIFYVVGGLLLVGAAVMLVAKKRVEGQN